jgi:hypothetical protein
MTDQEAADQESRVSREVEAERQVEDASKQLIANVEPRCPSSENDFKHRWRGLQCVLCGYVRPHEPTEGQP